MKSKIYILLIVISFTCSFSGYLQAQCCAPDSLKVKSKTDSSFCVQWRVKCDSSKGFQFQYKPNGPYLYTTVSRLYHHDSIYVLCDTSSACHSYQWRVRNICIKNRDTSYSSWVNGPAFTLPCRLSKSVTAQNFNIYTLTVTPSPAQNNVSVTGYFHGQLKLIITNLNGKEVMNKKIDVINNQLQENIDVSGFDKGFYFVIVTDGLHRAKGNFLKE